ncbi:hypothetical protein [Planctobacterium marinum]|uniref:Solute-binding protein family 3/N-terminal domain-containing protein n=1 Tax=Planctobacterium marinum TaxID=1631968 RepID=A0AA48HGL8_9ALTE|nr:hypothetical protein MACH26_04800 [Planctobacterium marinum]
MLAVASVFNRKVFKSKTFYFLLSLFIAVPAQAQEWRVVTELLPPLQIKQGENVAGEAVTRVRALLAANALELPIEVYPWARAYELAKNRPNTLIFSMARYASREQSFHWIGSMGEIQFSFIALADREEIQIHSVEDAQKWILGTVRNDFIHDWLLRKGFSEDKHFVVRSDLSELADLLYKGLIDGLLVNKEVITIIAAQKGYDAERIRAWFQPHDLSTHLYLGANIDSDIEVVKKLQASYLQLFQ